MIRLCVLVAIAAVSFSSANLLDNAGFEAWDNDSTPQAWRVETRSRTRVTVESDTVHSGASACRLTRLVAGTGNNSGVLQRVPAQAGTTYRWSVACLDESPLISLGMLVSWRRADSSYISSTSAEHSTDSSVWQVVADSGVAPESTAFADVIVRTYGETGAPAGLRVVCDDASFAAGVAPAESIRLWFVQDSIAARLVDFFDAAAVSVDYCCYNSSRPEVVLALIRAQGRGVRVRVITDNTRMDDSWVAYLRSAGIPVWSDSGASGASNYMHNKFVVRDLADADSTNDMVWNASYNANENETNADYGMELPSTALARAYRLEFNQMWGDTGMTPNPSLSRFHNAKTDVLPSHEFTVAGIPMRLYFSPQNHVVDTITAVAAQAQSRLGFAINSFTYNNLGDAMLSLWSAGRSVFGTFDGAGAGDSSTEYFRLRANHLPVLIDSVPFGTGMLHEKIMVVDSTVTVCGSANWSVNANNSNDENTLIITNHDIAARFMAEIVTRYLEAGGTYPPGIEEANSPSRPEARRRLSPARALPENAVAYDVLGRRVAARKPGCGVYFVVSPDGIASTAIIR